MPSLADRAKAGAPSAAASREQARVRVELALRAVSLVALLAAFLMLLDVFGSGAKSATAPAVFRADSAQKVTSTSLLGIVRQSLLSGVPVSALRPLHYLATRVPSDTNRALMSAMKVAGVPVSWTDSTKNGAVAIEARALVDPRGGFALRVAAPNGSAIAIQDSLGLIDSLQVAGGGGTVVAGRLAGTVSAASGAARASVVAPIAPVIRKVLLFAEPGWEAKFTTAALEERGWTVEARYVIGKNTAVTQGAPAAPDTARYAVVIALDSSAATHAAAIRRYAQMGGGVVIAGAATTLREFGNMLPGRVSTREPGVPGALETQTPLLGLAWRPITPDSDAAVVARSDRKSGKNDVTIAARRFGAGRVVETAYDGLWEWRMAGPDGSVDAHRQWWSSLVSSVAFAPTPRDTTGGAIKHFADVPGSAAPYADARARLGKSSTMPALEANVAGGTRWDLILMLVAVVSLLAEWASRRLRGAR